MAKINIFYDKQGGVVNCEIENKHIVNDIKNYEISPSPNSTIKQMLLYNAVILIDHVKCRIVNGTYPYMYLLP